MFSGVVHDEKRATKWGKVGPRNRRWRPLSKSDPRCSIIRVIATFRLAGSTKIDGCTSRMVDRTVYEIDERDQDLCHDDYSSKPRVFN